MENGIYYLDYFVLMRRHDVGLPTRVIIRYSKLVCIGTLYVPNLKT